MGVGCLLLGGPEYKIQIGATTYRFEMHCYCGPMPINHDGSERHLEPTHGFWEIVTFWIKQGERVENGRAVWEYPKPERPRTRPLEIKQCKCGEQMLRSNPKEEWWCPQCGTARLRLREKGKKQSD